MQGKLVSGCVTKATNNQMELLAILKAVECCPRAVNLHIISDSKVALGLVCRGWKGRNETLRMIRDSIQRTAFRKCIRLTCTLVKGHAGQRENDLVDVRARLAAKQEQSRQWACR